MYNLKKKFLALAVLALLWPVWLLQAQTDMPTSAEAYGQSVSYIDIKQRIQANNYDMNGNGVIDNFDKFAFFKFYNDSKTYLNQDASANGISPIFDLNGDGNVNQDDLNVSKAFASKLKKAFGLKIVTIAEMNTAIAEQRADVNRDGMVNQYDRNIANDFYKYVKKANNTSTSSPEWREAYDLNDDGTVNRDDASQAANFLKLIKTNNNQITVSASEISMRLYMLDPDLNSDGVVNLTDLYIYKGFNKNVRYCFGPVSDQCAFYDLNDDQVIGAKDVKWLNGFYKILKVQKDYAKSVAGSYEYDGAQIKAAIVANTFDLNRNSVPADDLDLLLYNAYASNLRGYNRQSFTPDASSTEPQAWELASYDLNNDNAINSLDMKILSTYYKAFRAAYREQMNFYKLNNSSAAALQNSNIATQ